jgi:4-amino-4-deoxy-L-arabinose transferase-like glycosyltransferase
MKLPEISILLLQARLWLKQRGAVAACGAVLCLIGSVTWLWHIPTAKTQRALEQQSKDALPTVSANLLGATSVERNMFNFYDLLGERRHPEQQIKTLFEIAAKNGLSLTKGQYKLAYEQNSRVYTYQIILPVKGTYMAIWQFGNQVLAAIPFASLDEISFKRDSIADNLPEARLRFTLYLNEGVRQQP